MSNEFIINRLQDEAIRQYQLIDRLQPTQIEDHYLIDYFKSIQQYIKNKQLPNEILGHQILIDLDCNSISVEGPIGIGKSSLLKLFSSTSLFINQTETIPFSCLVSKEITEQSSQPIANLLFLPYNNSSTAYQQQEKAIIKLKSQKDKGTIIQQLKRQVPIKIDYIIQSQQPLKNQNFIQNFQSQLSIDGIEQFNFQNYTDLYKNFKKSNIRTIFLAHNNYSFSTQRLLQFERLKPHNFKLTYFKQQKINLNQTQQKLQEPQQKLQIRKNYHIKNNDFDNYYIRNCSSMSLSNQSYNQFIQPNPILQLEYIFIGNQTIFPCQLLYNFFSLKQDFLLQIRKIQFNYISAVAQFYNINKIDIVINQRRSSYPFYVDVRGALMDIDFWQDKINQIIQIEELDEFSIFFNSQMAIQHVKQQNDIIFIEQEILCNSYYDTDYYKLTQIITINQCRKNDFVKYYQYAEGFYFAELLELDILPVIFQ